MTSTIRIPVYPHVRRYLEVQYGPRVYVYEHNYVSTFIRSMLKKFDKKAPNLPNSSPKMNLGATYDIMIGSNALHQVGAYLSEEDIRRFSKSIDLLIRRDMYQWCNHPNATDQVIDFNIRRFLDFYGFPEDDLPFANMKRWYYRERLRMNMRLNPIVDQEYQLLIDFSGKNTPGHKEWNEFKPIPSKNQLGIAFPH
ncbi:MAG: hypothetical protein U0X71_04815 [Sphingobacteriaceae bacterium]